MLEIDECVGAPQFTTQVFARHECARGTNQQREDTKWLLGQEEPIVVLGQLARSQIQREAAEANEVRIARNCWHA